MRCQGFRLPWVNLAQINLHSLFFARLALLGLSRDELVRLHWSTDFELAMINELADLGISAEACFFHLMQCVIRRIDKLGLRKRFDTDMR